MQIHGSHMSRKAYQNIKDKPKGKLKSKHQTEQIYRKEWKHLAHEFSTQVRVTKTCGEGTASHASIL